ncbi:hypothetical protein Tco_0437830 [Tanacetum coccineum]
MCEAIDLLRQSTKHQLQLIKLIDQILHSTIKIHIDLLPKIVMAKNLITMVNKTSTNILDQPENSITVHPGMTRSPSGRIDKGKGIATPYDDATLIAFMPLMEQGGSTSNLSVETRRGKGVE